MLDLLPDAYLTAIVPEAVAVETRLSLATTGSDRVPDLDRHPRIGREQVDAAALASAGATFLKDYRATSIYRIGQRQIDRPELEVVLLAHRHQALAVLEDHAGVLTARHFGVAVVGTAEILCDLEARGLVADAVALAQVVRKTRYHSHDLQLLASGSRRPQWRVPLGARPKA